MGIDTTALSWHTIHLSSLAPGHGESTVRLQGRPPTPCSAPLQCGSRCPKALQNDWSCWGRTLLFRQRGTAIGDFHLRTTC